MPIYLNRGFDRLLFCLLVGGALFMGDAVAAHLSDAGGYRSARFGMAEQAVIEAIESDFDIPSGSVERSANALEKTSSLTITVKDLVEHTGRTEIAYIFGYQSKKLIQVNLMWRVTSRFVGAKQRLKWAAQTMSHRIALWGIPRYEVKPNTKTADGATLLYRGQGKSGMVALISLKTPSEDKASLSVSLLSDEGYWLRVAFIESTSAPDIFKIEPGQF